MARAAISQIMWVIVELNKHKELNDRNYRDRWKREHERARGDFAEDLNEVLRSIVEVMEIEEDEVTMCFELSEL